MSNSVERWVSSKDIAEHLGVNKDTLHRWIKNQTIPCHRVGRLWKFRISEIDEWIQNGCVINQNKVLEDRHER